MKRNPCVTWGGRGIRSARQDHSLSSISAGRCNAQVAQLVEQRTENPCVGGSIPPLGTIAASCRRFCIVWLPSAPKETAMLQVSGFLGAGRYVARSPRGSISAFIRSSEVIRPHRGSFSVIASRPIDGSQRSPATRRVTPTRRPSIRSAVKRRPSAPTALAGRGKSRILGPDMGYNPHCVPRCGGRPMRGWGCEKRRAVQLCELRSTGSQGPSVCGRSGRLWTRRWRRCRRNSKSCTPNLAGRRFPLRDCFAHCCCRRSIRYARSCS